MGNTQSASRRQSAPRRVKATKAPRKFGLPSQKRAAAATPRRRFGFGKRAAPVATTSAAPATSTSMTLRRLKAKISPGPKVAAAPKHSKKRSRKHHRKEPAPVSLVDKLNPAVSTTPVAPRKSRGFGFGRRRQAAVPVTTKRSLFGRPKRY